MISAIREVDPVVSCHCPVPGVQVKRLAFPDAPAPAAPEMIDYMKLDAAKIAAAARKLLAA